MKSRIITRTILILSLVSLFTDMASEMLYPVMPIFLRSIGFSFLLIGILEGFAEATAGISKSYFGRKSDNTGKRLPFVQLGYFLSAISKPMMAAFVYPVWIFFARSIDRLGKGLRTAPRDSILSDESTPENKGKVFGFHRSMDTLGAVIGPAIALVFLYFYPGQYKLIFLVAFVPGVAAVVSTLLIKEKKKNPLPENEQQQEKFFAIFSYWKKSSLSYKKLVAALLFFALFNSSDVFLLLKIKDTGLSDTSVIGIYIFYNLVYALLSYPVGILADKIGMKKIFLTGLFIFSVVYAGFAINKNIYIFLFLFFLYGIYASATEGISKAWISNMVSKKETATAIGSYTGLQSISALIASSLTGFLWILLGASATFLITSIATLFVIIYLYFNRLATNYTETDSIQKQS
ncbi:MAG: MFS transporter [Bacteroidota bacterium]|nr:MFS transporter [Bacteroidota bacterium]